jgi:uncharacterized membrane protein YfcA
VSPVIDLAGSLPTWGLLALLVAIAMGAGLVGSLIGIGGGIFIVPALVLVFGLDIHYAVAASLLAVVANSCASGSLYVEQGITDLRVGMFLETSTVVGGFIGATLAVSLLASRSNVLNLAFVPVVGVAAVLMLWHYEVPPDPRAPPDRLAERLRLSGSYVEPTTGASVPFTVRRPLAGLGLTGLAGLGSGLLGVGGGIFNVPAMNAVMNVPMRVATSTSTFKIGVTASAAALVYLVSGDVILFVAAPIAIGSVVGSLVGGHLQARAPVRSLTYLFVAVLAIAAALMAARGLGYVG